MIYVIPLWKMMIVMNGKAAGLAILASVPAFVIGGVIMFLKGLQSGDTRQAIIGLFCSAFFGLCFILFIPQVRYKPGKSFAGYRSKGVLIGQSIKYGYLFVGVLIIGFLVLYPKSFPWTLGYGISGLVALYTTQISVKQHGDVDFVVNEYLAKALGIDIGEKVLVTYQNFDSENLKKGSCIFAASATNLVVATFDGQQWNKLSRNLNQITQLGISANAEQIYFIKLVFTDGDEAMLRIGLFDKLTSNPTLVIKRLLEAVDDSILGSGSVRQETQRRRVIVSDDTNASIQKSTTIVQKPSATAFTARNIELTTVILEGIKNATEVPSRKLEL